MVDIRLYMQRERTLCGHGKTWCADLGDGPVTIGCTKCLPLEELFEIVEVLMFQWFAAHDIEEDVFELPACVYPSRLNPSAN